MGSIKIDINSFETAEIAPELRDMSVTEFSKMKRLAQDDLFYCTTEFYSHEFSYGSYWDLMFGDITRLLGKPSLFGITSTTLEYFRSVNSQCRRFDELENEIAFQQCALPRAIGAFDDGNRGLLPKYVCNELQWNKWHHDWLTQNPSQIKWGDPNNEVLPYPEMVREFMRKELTDGNFSQSWKKVDFADRIDNKWRLRADEIVSAFHYCMGCLDERERISRTKQYGAIICEMNHYLCLSEASRMETDAAQSPRYIYGLKHNGRWQFVSLDTRHGFFEFVNEHGDHLGEKRFDGSFNSEEEVDHGFRVISQWIRNL